MSSGANGPHLAITEAVRSAITAEYERELAIIFGKDGEMAAERRS